MQEAHVVENIRKRHNWEFTIVALAETGHATGKVPTDEAAFGLRMMNEAYLEIMAEWIRKNVTGKKSQD